MRFFFLTLLLIFSVPSPSSTQDIFKTKDEDGKVIYTTKERDGATPVKLPNITKEKPSARLNQIKAKAPGTCADHGGIDCLQGADTDGSVICKDGNREAVLPYRFECLSASLESDILVKVYGEETIFRLAEVKRDKKLLNKLERRAVEKIIISIRNLSEIDAEEVSAKVVIEENKVFNAQGPENIAAFGLADFTLEPIVLSTVLRLRKIEDMRVDVACTNCKTVKRKQ